MRPTHRAIQTVLKAVLPVVGIACLWYQAAFADVTLSSDFSNNANKREQIYNFWSVRNQIPAYPSVGSQQSPQANSVNCIRLLGGWSDSSGSMLELEDVCYWDGTQYSYRWSKLTGRIDAVRAQGKQIHQLVLDNVPWCFQRGLTFNADGSNGSYKESDRVTTYGNSLPPGDPGAWNAFIVATMNKLIQTYGLAEVEKWQFRIGTESDYRPHHWAGSKTDFFNHYRNTANAVLSVLPNAKLASHFLGAGGNGRYGAEFVTWCSQNNVKCDFFGVSTYPFYKSVNLDNAWNADFKPFVDAPGWDSTKHMEIPEYSLFTERDDDGFNMGVGTSHNAAFVGMLAKMVYDHSMTQVHSWGDHTKDPTFLALATMLGNDRYIGQKSGAPGSTNNKIDGIFCADSARTAVNALIYNYNANPAYLADEPVNISLTVPMPAGTAYKYRIATYDRDTNVQQLFVKDNPLAGKWESEGGWVINRIYPTSTNQTDKNGLLDQILVEPGKTLYKNGRSAYAQYNELQWSGWTTIVTTAGGVTGISKLSLTVPLSSFSFQKIEFRVPSLPPPWEQGDIGSPTAGSAREAAGVFTVQGSGADIWSTADQFQAVYRPVRGDCEIVARVASLTGVTNPWAKVGVMIRETLAANSPLAATFVTPGSGATFQQRSVAGGNSVNTVVSGLSAPYWVKIKRNGDTFTSFRSANGINWTAIGSPTTITMGADVYLSLAVTSHDNGKLVTAVFDNVAISPATSDPVANAGPDQIVSANSGNASVTLNGSASTSGNGSITGYVWEENGLQIATGANPTVSLGSGVHTLILTVADVAALTATDTVQIRVEGSIHSNFADASPISNGSLGSTASDLTFFCGRAGASPGVNRSPVFVFLLPDLGPVSNPFSSAFFSVNLASLNGVPTANADLYGLARISTSSAVLTGDYFGDSTPDAAATLLEAGLITPSSPTGITKSSVGGNSSLTTFFNAKYNSGAGASKFVFLRLSNDAAMSNNLRYVFTSADGAAAANDGAGDTNIWPQLSYTTNTPPTITAVSDLAVAVNTNIGAIAFTVGDLETPVSSLTLSGFSSNPALVPPSNLVFGGSAAERTVIITPVANLLASSTITLTVNDGTRTSNASFEIRVTGNGSQTWRFANFGTTANSGTASDAFDANGDGENNLVEFGTGQSPVATSITSTPVARKGDNLEFTYTRSRAAMADGIIFNVQWSEMLARDSWSSADTTEQVLTDDGTLQTIKATVAVGPNTKRFMRLEIVVP